MINLELNVPLAILSAMTSGYDWDEELLFPTQFLLLSDYGDDIVKQMLDRKFVSTWRTFQISIE